VNGFSTLDRPSRRDVGEDPEREWSTRRRRLVVGDLEEADLLDVVVRKNQITVSEARELAHPSSERTVLAVGVPPGRANPDIREY